MIGLLFSLVAIIIEDIGISVRIIILILLVLWDLWYFKRIHA